MAIIVLVRRESIRRITMMSEVVQQILEAMDDIARHLPQRLVPTWYRLEPELRLPVFVAASVLLLGLIVSLTYVALKSLWHITAKKLKAADQKSAVTDAAPHASPVKDDASTAPPAASIEFEEFNSPVSLRTFEEEEDEASDKVVATIALRRPRKSLKGSKPAVKSSREQKDEKLPASLAPPSPVMKTPQPRRRRQSLQGTTTTPAARTAGRNVDNAGSTFTPAGVRRSARIARTRS